VSIVYKIFNSLLWLLIEAPRWVVEFFLASVLFIAIVLLVLSFYMEDKWRKR